MRETALGLSLLAVVLSGCKVQVDKSSNGEGDNVKIATPFGGISVNKDQTSRGRTWSPCIPRVGAGYREQTETGRPKSTWALAPGSCA